MPEQPCEAHVEHVSVLLLQAVAGKLPIRDVLFNKSVTYLLVAVDCSQQQLEALPVPDPESLLKLHAEGCVSGIILTCAGRPPPEKADVCLAHVSYPQVLLYRACCTLFAMEPTLHATGCQMPEAGCLPCR